MQDDYAYIAKELGADNEKFAGKTVLLVGSNGFLGRLYQQYFSYLNSNVLQKPVKLICLDNTAYLFDNAAQNHIMVYGDIVTGWTSVRENIYDKVWINGLDYIINAAGLASPLAYSSRPFDTIDVSVQGTNNILTLAKKLRVESVLCFSSSEIYGNPDLVPTPESYLGKVEIYSERACYDYGKLMLEVLCYLHNNRHDMNIKVVRPFNVLGYSSNDGRVVPNSVSRLMNDEKLKVFLPGTQTRTFCWFSDFIVGSIKVLLHGDHNPYNIGNSNNEISMIDLMHKLEAISGKKDMVELIQPSDVYKTEPMRRCPDITKARNELGYDPKISIDTALQKFWNWAKINYR